MHSNKLNPQAESFKPRTETSTKCSSDPKSGTDLNQAFVDMTNFMTKKSFIIDRVKPFSGDSEHNHKVCAEIEASPSVELDLMITNLRGQPLERVRSIKNSNSSDSVLAVQMAWERLD